MNILIAYLTVAICTYFSCTVGMFCIKSIRPAIAMKQRKKVDDEILFLSKNIKYWIAWPYVMLNFIKYKNVK